MDRNKRTTTPPNADSNPAAPSPVTPRRVPNGSTGGIDGKLLLQSTPSNLGSASVSEYSRSARYGFLICLYGVFIIIHSVESVGPPIIADVKHYKINCTVDSLLKAPSPIFQRISRPKFPVRVPSIRFGALPSQSLYLISLRPYT